MKLGKEEVQKIGLSAVMLVALLYCYFSMLLGPLSTQEAAANATIADLKKKIDPAEASVKEAEALEKKSPDAVATLDQVRSLIPDGAPVAWFPERINNFFKRQGIDKTAAHVGSELGDKDLTGFKKLGWSIDVPAVEVVPLAIAIAALENEQQMIEVTSIQIDTLKDDVQFQRAVIVLSTIVKQ